jgi:hypothetical protein
MSRRDQLFILSGGVIGAVLTYGSVRWSNAHSGAAPRGEISAIATAEIGRGDDDRDATVDPAMEANANLSQSLHECSQKLASLMDEKAKLEQELDAERMSEVDASRAVQVRRMARRNISQDDWKQLASAGTIRYVLPCASFNPSPEVMDRLGLAQRDVPAIQSAFTAARDTAWTQIRPLCATAVGSAGAADRLGLDLCPQAVFDSEKTSNPAGADAAMRAVGAVKAGLSEPSAIPSGDPVGTAFLVLTGVAKDAETRLASMLSADDARSVVYGNNNCSRVSEFTTPTPEAAAAR